MSLITLQRGITELFKNLEDVSRYNDITFTKFPNGVYRYDVKLQYSLVVRFILDPAKRTRPIYMIGCYMKGKFIAINHYYYDVDFERFNARSAAKDLVKEFVKLTDEYRFRLSKVK